MGTTWGYKRSRSQYTITAGITLGTSSALDLTSIPPSQKGWIIQSDFPGFFFFRGGGGIYSHVDCQSQSLIKANIQYYTIQHFYKQF